MEIGHIPMMPDGPLDGAGNQGSLESLSSRLAIASDAAAAAYRGQAPYLLKNHGTDLADIRSGALSESVKNKIEKAARKRVLPSMADVFEIKEAKLGDDAGVMGSAALAEQAFGDE